MSNDSIVKFRTFDKVECCFDMFAVFGNDVAGTKFRPFDKVETNLFRLYRKNEISFDTDDETGNIVAENGNNVEATFDIVERIVQLVAFDNVASTLLLVWTGH